MRKKLNIFVDPIDGKPLRLRINKETKGHVISGALVSGKGQFPIINGIPRFVDKAFYAKGFSRNKEHQTSDSFGAKWRDRRNRQLGNTAQDIKGLLEQFLPLLGCHSLAELKSVLEKAKRILNAGCGVAWPEYLFNYYPKTERHCIDISLAIETAFQRTKNIQNVIVSQASIFGLPYPDNTFDIIYSDGVIHHTPNPQSAFMSLVKKLRPGGLIGIYIYNKKPFLRELADHEIRKITSRMSYRECLKFARQMTDLGKALHKVKTSVTIKNDIQLLGIHKGKYKIHNLIYNHFLKCWYNKKQDNSYADLVNQDWYHPGYASHHTKEEITAWFNAAGLKKPTFIQPKGWEYSGFFVSGEKRC